jgi:hypothetical protein
MALYRCDFLDSCDRIEDHEEIDAVSLFEAIDRANAMLNERRHHDAVEIWAGRRWIYRAGRDKAFAYRQRAQPGPPVH